MRGGQSCNRGARPTCSSSCGDAWWVLGLAQLSAPFKGGVLVPSPDLIVGPVPLDGVGSLSTTFAWPAGLPTGTELFWQTWISDVAGPIGFAATNGLRSTTP